MASCVWQSAQFRLMQRKLHCLAAFVHVSNFFLARHELYKVCHDKMFTANAFPVQVRESFYTAVLAACTKAARRDCKLQCTTHRWEDNKCIGQSSSVFLRPLRANQLVTISMVSAILRLITFCVLSSQRVAWCLPSSAPNTRRAHANLASCSRKNPLANSSVLTMPLKQAAEISNILALPREL